MKFSYINKNKFKKLTSTVLVTTMLGSSTLMLTGCSDNNKDLNPSLDSYAIVIEGDTAFIYNIYYRHTNICYKSVVLKNTGEEIVLPETKTYILKQGFDLSYVEEFASELTPENGKRKYVGFKNMESANEKIFTKSK